MKESSGKGPYTPSREERKRCENPSMSSINDSIAMLIHAISPCEVSQETLSKPTTNSIYGQNHLIPQEVQPKSQRMPSEGFPSTNLDCDLLYIAVKLLKGI
ncbi:hypothetical protein JTE90_011736 [Oedothorax gibbosus]|uniref:Uncharacterized protein n=1 Tax=Oedothorax gibbosus TaxID=931172 RepID=A0AAV6TS65_9ARAC|nr:hypothetical protein JTE90_011736 [Oedothorax gibbosus]